jgi:hypothetical protein
MIIARVFPRRTKATPSETLAFVGDPGLFPPEVDAVHVSVAFSWDLKEAERLARAWRRVAPVSIGGPATGERGGDFVPGRYLRKGYVITSRGCHNRCWFCSVWKREGDVRELPITDGWNVLDDNLLACSDEHIKAVFAMLKRQKHRIEFTGGLEAKILKPWHCESLSELKPKQLFFAYDTPDDREPLFEAGKMLASVGFTAASHVLRAYALVGYPGDTFDKAEWRLNDCITAGFLPMAMLYRDKSGQTSKEWRRFQRQWARPAIISKRAL